jgi:hypothetical protein
MIQPNTMFPERCDKSKTSRTVRDPSGSPEMARPSEVCFGRMHVRNDGNLIAGF